MQKPIEILKRDERTGPVKDGRFKPHRDSEGYWTIGFGRRIDHIGISSAGNWDRSIFGYRQIR